MSEREISQKEYFNIGFNQYRTRNLSGLMVAGFSLGLGFGKITGDADLRGLTNIVLSLAIASTITADALITGKEILHRRKA